jgi:hypothetical protein
MSDIPMEESKSPAATTAIVNDEPAVSVALPNKRKYRSIRLFGHKFWFASPKIQLAMVSFVCFLCPGMFNALGGMGGGGKTDATLADNMVSKAVPSY